jgi:REP element-mobilizing transposase RayT
MLAACRRRYRVAVHCYCLVPEEIHLLLEAADGDVSRPMQSLNTTYALYVNKRYAERGHLFARPYSHAVVEKNHYMLEASRRIHLLPSARGLTDDSARYPWSSFGAYLGHREDSLLATSTARRLLGPARDLGAAYASYVADGSRSGWDPQGPGDKVVGSSAFQLTAARSGIGAAPRPERSLAELASTAALHYGMSRESLLNGRLREQVWRRQVFMYLSTTTGGYSLRELGRLCGGAAPSTVHHAVRRVAATAPGSPMEREIHALAGVLFPSSTGRTP